jgi:hypothetical protein
MSACDTIIQEDYPLLDHNWIGVSRVKSNKGYLTLYISGGLVRGIYDKGAENATLIASIGLYGIKDYQDFWNGLRQPTIVEGEYQDTAGLKELAGAGLKEKYFTWFDTGSTEGYINANTEFNKDVS